MADVLTFLAFFGGLVLVAVGVSLVSLPAGLVVAGLELAGVAFAYSRADG